MTISSITPLQRKGAKVAGFSYLITLIIVVYVNFAIHERLIVDKDARQTAQNILAHEQIFRFSIAADLLYCAGVVVLLTALYIILRPVNPLLSLLGALWRLIWVFMWLMMTIHLFDALRLITGAPYLESFQTDQLQALARLDLGSNFEYYYVGLLFDALASTVCAWLWAKSHYIPRVLALFGIISSAFCVACTVIFYIFPNFNDMVNLWWFDSPMAIFNIATSFWLLFKGLRSREEIKSYSATE